MLLRKCVSTMLLLFLTGSAFAATEYLRFVESGAGASAYYDFQVDTNLNVPGSPDSSYQDNFYVRYLAGSLGVPGTTTLGRTSTFPEGKISQLFITGYWSVGSRWRSPEDVFDDSINTWIVGDRLWLLKGGYFDISQSLVLTHRSSTVLPLHVPLPQAAWLFASGLLVLVGLRKQK